MRKSVICQVCFEFIKDLVDIAKLNI